MEEYWPEEPVVPNDEPEQELAARWRQHFYDNNPKTTGYKWLDNIVKAIVNKIYHAIKNHENGYPLELPARLPPGPERDAIEQRERDEFDAIQDLPWRQYIKKNVRIPMVIYLSLMHILALVALAMIPFANPLTVVFTILLWPVTALGITGGAHRLWAHRSYKAGVPVRNFLMILNSMANQGTIFHWARDHRVHHKCSETPADPHNALRGFFFAHMGWLLVKKDPRVKQFGDTINLDDLVDMWEVRFQKHMGFPWTFFWCFIFPALIANSMWGESIGIGIMLPGVLRYIIGLHCTWLVNSAAHLYGERPYENINPAENPWVSLGAIGEGWHNWHHAFPFDYAASELGWSKQFNPTKIFIDSMAHLGMVHSRKRATDHWKRRMEKLSEGEKVHKKLIGLEGFKRRVVTYGDDREERIYGDQTPVKFADVLANKVEKLKNERFEMKEEPRDRTPEEVMQHNKDEDCWIVIHNKVYDVTNFLEEHPGGEEAVAVFGGKVGRGKDATQSFDDTGHSEMAHDMLEDFFVGRLVASQTKRSSVKRRSSRKESVRKESVSSKRSSKRLSTSSRRSSTSSKRSSTRSEARPGISSISSTGSILFKNSRSLVGFSLVEKEIVTHDTIKLRFSPFRQARGVLGLPTGNHVRVLATVNDKSTERSYTPVPNPGQESDDMTLVVKVYRAGVHPDFPDGGAMSQHLDSLDIGDRIAVKGPLGGITYHGRGELETRKRGSFNVANIGFICGGSGITPAFSIIHAALTDKKDKTKLFLIYANKTPSDILLRKELEKLAKKYSDRFHLHFTVDDGTEEADWQYSTGFVSEEMVKEHLPDGSAGDSFVGVCGPPGMIKYACNPNLEAHGYVKGETFTSF